MACFVCLTVISTSSFVPSLSLSLLTHNQPKLASFNPSRFPLPANNIFPISTDTQTQLRRRRSVVTRAGPTANQFTLAFVLPLALVILTIFAALRISDKLDERYIEEILLSEAMKETDDDEDGDDDDEEEDYDDNDDDDEDDIELPIEPPMTLTPRTRNRPKREI